MGEGARRRLAMLTPTRPLAGRTGGNSGMFPHIDSGGVGHRQFQNVVAVQVRGKLKTTLKVAAGSDEDEVKALALENEKVQNTVAGRDIVKVIYIPDKLLNLVTK